MRIGTLTCSQAAALEELQLNGDLDSAVEQVLRDVADLPVSGPDAAGGRVEVGPLAGVQRMLALGPGAQQAAALLAELSLQVGDEGERLVAENLPVAITLCVDDLDALVTPHLVPPA